MDAVGADQRRRPRSRRRSRTAPRRGRRDLLDADAAMREMHALAAAPPCASSACSSPRWKIMCGAPNSLLDRVAEPRLGQRAAVLPAALMKERRAERHLGAFLAEAEPDQEARGVRADVDAGADFAEQARLLVDLHVEAGLQQADRGGQPADAAADDGRSSDVRRLAPFTRRACRAPGRSPRPRRPGRRRRTAPAAASPAPAPDRRGCAPAAPSRRTPAACRRTACGW